MLCRWIQSCSISAAVVLLLASSGSAARLFLASHPTNIDPTDKYCDLLLRELPRQELISIAIDDLGADVVDATLESGAKAADGDVKIDLTRRQSRDGHFLHVELLDNANKSIDKTDISYDFLFHGIARVQSLVAKMDKEDRPRWQALLAGRLSLSPRPIQWDANSPAPEGIEKYLATIDFQNAYMATRMAHRAIAQDGESPARLGVLIRAYTHLAEANRDLDSAHSAAMFARAYVYSQRLMRQAPDDPASYWHRAYLETLHGSAVDAIADFKRADELAHGAQIPEWATLARQLLAYDTMGLYQKTQENKNLPLSSYFAWRTVEHSGLAGLTTFFAKLALQNNPHSLRAFDSINWNSGDKEAFDSVPDSMKILHDMVRELVNTNDIPAPIQQAVVRANNDGFVPPAVKTMLATFSAQPHDDDPHLTWAGYASIVREWHFNQVFTRLWYIDWDTCSDAESEIQLYWPLVADHRYAPLIASMDRNRRSASPAVVQQVRNLRFSDDTSVFEALHISHYLNQKLNIPQDSVFHTNWSNYIAMISDKTAFDIAMGDWFGRRSLGAGYDEWDRINNELLDQLAPNHPMALIHLAVIDPGEVQPRAEQLERDMGDNPMFCFALGTMYSHLKEYRHATILLAKAAEYSPDKPVFRELASSYLAQNDMNAFLRTWDRYFKSSQDIDHEFGFAYEEIALKLIAAGQPDKAVPYAQRSMGSAGEYAQTHSTYLLALTRAGMYEDAEREASGDAYLPIGQYYRWCIETGRGNLQRAQMTKLQAIPVLLSRAQPGAIVDASVFTYLDGNVDKAMQLIAPAVEKDQDGCAAHWMALMLLEHKPPEEARKVLERRSLLPTNDYKDRAYVAAAEQMLRCLADPDALPAVDGPLAVYFADPNLSATQGNVFYLFGRICELTNHPNEAKQWYRQSLDALSSTFTFRPLAAVALRKLGEEYYK